MQHATGIQPLKSAHFLEYVRKSREGVPAEVKLSKFLEMREVYSLELVLSTRAATAGQLGQRYTVL